MAANHCGNTSHGGKLAAVPVSQAGQGNQVFLKVGSGQEGRTEMHGKDSTHVVVGFEAG